MFFKFLGCIDMENLSNILHILVILFFYPHRRNWNPLYGAAPEENVSGGASEQGSSLKLLLLVENPLPRDSPHPGTPPLGGGPQGLGPDTYMYVSI